MKFDSLINKVFSNRILIIVLVGLVARIVFTLFFAKAYYGTDNIYYNYDSGAWALCFQNLFYSGSFSIDLTHPLGYFVRMPGYSFYLGGFYLLCGKDWTTTFFVAGWFQIAMDTLNIFLIYRITYLISNQSKAGLITSMLYAFYPFVIVWNPLCYSEIPAITFMLLSLFFMLSRGKRNYAFFSVSFLSLGILFRPQLFLLLPFVGIYILIPYLKTPRALLTLSFQMFLGFLICYMPWPIRNYINHDKILLTHDLRGFANWDKDVMSFTFFIYSVQAEWEPQFSQIITNKNVEFPIGVSFSKQDSLLLSRAFFLSKNCGKGFSKWRGYWKEPISSNDCNDSISEIFTSLREKQVKQNPLNFWIYLPLQNLKKAIFKDKLYDTKTTIRKIASTLFYYRTFLILLGVVCSLVLLKLKTYRLYLIMTLGFFVLLYMSLCAGTGPLMRNIEIRYFLPADVLLIIPIGIFFSKNKKLILK
jgi:hypothetical protein